MTRCSHYYEPNNRCGGEAKYHLMVPIGPMYPLLKDADQSPGDGVPSPGGWYCEECGKRIAAEYQDKVGRWTLARCDDYGCVRDEAHQVEQPDGTWAVHWRGRCVLEEATYVVASHVVHELSGGRCGVGECREVAQAIRDRVAA